MHEAKSALFLPDAMRSKTKQNGGGRAGARSKMGASGQGREEGKGEREGGRGGERGRMFGDAQMSASSDYIQAALMLRYNGRRI